MLNVQTIRDQFPILKRQIHDHPLVYFDNAATTQKPQAVLDAITDYYSQHNANINRGVHVLAEESTLMYEAARQQVASFIGARPEEIIFVRNTTEAINLLAYRWGLEHLHSGDEIIVSIMEHHSNLVPWQMVAERTGAELKYLDIDANGQLQLGKHRYKTEQGVVLGGLESLLSHKTKMVSLVHVSNTLGTINPIEAIAKNIKKFNKDILVVVDAAQSIPHMEINVGTAGKKLERGHHAFTDIDFLAFSAHKMYGPMGIGVLWGRRSQLEQMPPFLSGGDMIKEVYLDHTVFNTLPEKFEAGTPNVADAIGFQASIQFLQAIGMHAIAEYENALVTEAVKVLTSHPNVSILGPSQLDSRGSLVAFTYNGVHAHDFAQVFDSLGIAIRSGHHCTMPLHRHLNLAASCRISFGIYNTLEEVHTIVVGLEKVEKVFQI